MSNRKSREIRLKSRPVGQPTQANFELAEVEIGDPGPGQVLVRNAYMTVDPYMRGRMMDRQSYVPPFQIGEALTGGAVGQVVAAGAGANFKVGDHVMEHGRLARDVRLHRHGDDAEDRAPSRASASSPISAHSACRG